MAPLAGSRRPRDDIRHGTPPALGAERKRRLESRHSRARQQFTGRLGRPDLYHDRLGGRQRAKNRLLFARPTGRLLWQASRRRLRPLGKRLYTKNTFASSTAVTDGQRVIAFFGNGGLLCVDFEGHQQWHVDLGLFPTMHGPGTSPVLYKDEVICIQYQTRGKSLFAAFDKRTGAKLWQQERENAACWSTPVVRSHRRSRPVGL